jgi:hypothetical protein
MVIHCNPFDRPAVVGQASKGILTLYPGSKAERPGIMEATRTLASRSARHLHRVLVAFWFAGLEDHQTVAAPLAPPCTQASLYNLIRMPRYSVQCQYLVGLMHYSRYMHVQLGGPRCSHWRRTAMPNRGLHRLLAPPLQGIF